MLGAKDLKPHVLHADVLVREAVVEWFEKSWSRDPELIPLVLEAARRHGLGETCRELLALPAFVPDERGLRAALGALPEWADEDAGLVLNRLIAGAPADLLGRYESEILGTRGVLEETARRVHRRRELLDWPAEKLWGELEDLAGRSSGRHVGEIDHGLANDLIDVLARHESPEAGHLCERVEGAEGWLEIFAVDLAGVRRLREAVPALVDKFRIDTDYLLERAVIALARIGDPAAVRRIRSDWPSADWNYRNYASGVLADIKGEESEEALLELLPRESDGGLRVWLCLALCQQFSRRGLEPVLREIRSGYEPGCASLEEAVLPAAELLGVELREAAEWRAFVEAERAEQRSRARDLDRMWAGLEEQGEDGSGEPAEDWLEDPWLDPPPGEGSPYRRPVPKVRRNAPCPCGSGRKFKRCCGAP
jgi:hypothetical protein